MRGEKREGGEEGGRGKGREGKREGGEEGGRGRGREGKRERYVLTLGKVSPRVNLTAFHSSSL